MRSRIFKWKRRHLSSVFLLIPFIFLVIMMQMLSKKEMDTSSSNFVGVDHQQMFDSSTREFYSSGRKGIPVVVGHYVGIKSITNGPLSKDDLNRNDYNPIPGMGEMGEPVQLSPLEIGKMQKYYDVNKFNILASDRISVNRSLPDVRKKECITKVYQNLSTTTSVIIVFHNEAWSTLMRTVHSVINRSPRHLLHEIILVDDASERTFLKDELDTYVAQLPVLVTVLHVEERVGLVRARLQGAALAQGQVLTFLDAHCECTIGWLEPLLARVAENRTTVVVPVIDILNDDTFAYVRSFEMHWGAINWDLHYRWFTVGPTTTKLRKKDFTKPFKTPIMAGGLFAIDKAYFYEMGSYDPEMDIWGGENIEISFRIWQCGGSIEIVPCSRVGHVFRKASPYTFPRPGGIADTLATNLARVAEVWMDEWKEFFYRIHPEVNHIRRNLNVSSRMQLREKLGCRSFRWYLENVWPENFFPSMDLFVGQFLNMGSKECLRRPNGKNTGNAITAKCNHIIITQFLFVLTADNYLMTDESVCLDAPDLESDQPAVFFLACAFVRRQQWRIDTDSGRLVHLESGFCLESLSETVDKDSRTLILNDCNSAIQLQEWKLEPFTWK